LLTDELGRGSKKEVVAEFEVFSGNFLDEIREARNSFSG
jgi:hypothetical protein